MTKRFGILSALFVLLAVLTSIASAQDAVTVKLWMHNHPPRVPLDDAQIGKRLTYAQNTLGCERLMHFKLQPRSSTTRK